MPTEHAAIVYSRMPPGSENGGADWINTVPARYIHGQNGFDRRIMQDLAAVEVPCYVLNDLANGPATIPQGISIFVGWLANLETHIPGPETEHRYIIRTGLIRNLIDPAARGNQQAIDLLIAQVRHQPTLPTQHREWACAALGVIATEQNFTQIADLLANLPEGTPKSALVEYLGTVETPQARELAISYLESGPREAAITALVQMKATGERHLIEPLLNHPYASLRTHAERALDMLPS